MTPIMTASELIRLSKERAHKMDAVFDHDEVRGYITLNIAYPYHIELDRITNKADLLEWTLHLCSKTWMTKGYMVEFINRVFIIKGWNHERL